MTPPFHDDPEIGARRPEVVVLPLSGRPEAGTGVNLLTRAALATDGVTPAYYDCFVTIAPR